MTPSEFRDTIARLNLSQNATADLLRIGTRTVRRWASGGGDIPRVVEILLRLMIVLNIKPSALRTLVPDAFAKKDPQ